MNRVLGCVPSLIELEVEGTGMVVNRRIQVAVGESGVGFPATGAVGIGRVYESGRD